MKNNATLVNTKIETVDVVDNVTTVRCLSTINAEKLPVNTDEIHRVIKDYFPNVNFTGKTILFNTEGVAKCLPEDTFDEKTGLHIAESRAQQKAYSIASRLYYCFNLLLAEKVNTLALLTQNAYNCEMHCAYHQLDLGNCNF